MVTRREKWQRLLRKATAHPGVSSQWWWCYLPIDLQYQHRPAAGVSHLISVPPGFPGSS
jgi:hypothetical protein